MKREVAANEAIFFTVEDIMAKTGWGEKAVLNMFNVKTLHFKRLIDD